MAIRNFCCDSIALCNYLIANGCAVERVSKSKWDDSKIVFLFRDTDKVEELKERWREEKNYMYDEEPVEREAKPATEKRKTTRFRGETARTLSVAGDRGELSVARKNVSVADEDDTE